jgi:5-methylcytosine-specific restriction endonuclease McrA
MFAINSNVSKKEKRDYRDNPNTSNMDDRMRKYAAKNKHIQKDREVKMCQNCGAVSIIGGQRLIDYRKSISGLFYCDKECAYQDRRRVYLTSEEYRAKVNANYVAKYGRETWQKDVCVLNWAECNHCGKQFVQRNGNQSCSEACRRAVDTALYEQRKERQRLAYEKQSGDVACLLCGKRRYVEKNLALRKFCSKRCALKAVKQRREHWMRTNGPCEYIDIDVLIKKHKSKCVQCGVKVVAQSGEYQDNAATIDHKIPLSKGGWHTWNNVQLMCHRCNSHKSDSVKHGTQLMLTVLE